MAFLTCGLFHLRPIKRLAAQTVLSALVTGLTLRDVTDQALTRLGERDHRRRGLVATTIGNHDRLSALEHCDTRVRGAQIDANDLLHPSFRARARVRRASNTDGRSHEGRSTESAPPRPRRPR